MLTRLVRFLYCFTLVLGPLWVGSYFGAWRWPMLCLATVVGLLALFVAPPKSKRPSFFLLVSLLLILAGQGVWMWYNAETFLVANAIYEGVHYLWHLEPVADQPAPGWPGVPDRAQAWDRLSCILPCLLMLFATRQLVAYRVLKLRVLCGTLFWTGVAVAVLGLLQRMTEAQGIYWSSELSYHGRPLFFGTFRSPGIAAAYLNSALAMGGAHLLAEIRLRYKAGTRAPMYPLCVFVGVVAVCVASVSAGSKAGAVLAIITLVMLAAFCLKQGLKALRSFPSLFPNGSTRERNVLVAALVLGLILGVLGLGGTVVDRWKSTHENGYGTLVARQEANKVQVAMVEDPSWGAMGHGPGSFLVLFPYYVQSSGADIHTKWDYAHNDPLQTLVEWGWLGTGCFVVLMGGAVFILLWESSLRRGRHRSYNVVYMRGVIVALTVCLLQSTIDFPLQIESIAMCIAVLVGAAWGSMSLRSNEE